MYIELQSKIEMKDAKVAVIGLGYVGLPLAIVLADAGFRVWGIDTNETRAGAVSAGDWPLDADEPHLPEMLREVVKSGKLSATPGYATCRDADIMIVCVPTPVGEDKCPDYGALWSALCGIGDNARPPALVILESTLAPMTTEDAAQMLGDSFWIAHCPERVTPKRLLTNLRYMPRIVGGYTVEAAQLAGAMYRSIAPDVDLHHTDALTAEIVKCAENAYRDVQIAFANELAVICDQLGADVWEVRELVNTCPGRDMLRPGPGVGGACLTKDSWLLASALPEPPLLMLTAREVNDGMAGRVVGLVIDALNEAQVSLSLATVVILGAAYRAGTSDVRESPAARVMLELNKAGIEVRFYDPRVDGYNGDLEVALTHADAAVIATDHAEFIGLDWSALARVMRHWVLIDARGIMKEAPYGFVFRGLGRGAVGL